MFELSTYHTGPFENIGEAHRRVRDYALANGFKPADGTQLELSYAINHGRSDRNGDGKVDSDLDGANIAPNRLNLSWTQRWSDALSSYLHVSRVASRNFATLGQRNAHFDGYTTADAYLKWASGDAGDWTLGVQNLVNRQYINYVSQTVGDDASYFAGRGRVVSLTWQQAF